MKKLNRLFVTVLVAIAASCSKDDGPFLKYEDHYQGGIVFYIFQEGDKGFVPGETHGLIASFDDLQTADGELEVPWGCCANTMDCLDISVVESIGIGYGQENTLAILAVCDEPNIAARLCDDYSIEFEGEVYDDWYLPSIREIKKMHTFKKSILPMFTDNWSSTQNPNNRDMAVSHYLVDDQCLPSSGYPPEEACFTSIDFDYSKASQLKVRAVRNF